MGEPREFWLENKTIVRGQTWLVGDEIGDDADNVIYGPRSLKVIEKSAFTELQAQADMLAEALEQVDIWSSVEYLKLNGEPIIKKALSNYAKYKAGG
jgi:hypothetical protein